MQHMVYIKPARGAVIYASDFVEAAGAAGFFALEPLE
jgi:hypothetical protein